MDLGDVTATFSLHDVSYKLELRKTDDVICRTLSNPLGLIKSDNIKDFAWTDLLYRTVSDMAIRRSDNLPNMKLVWEFKSSYGGLYLINRVHENGNYYIFKDVLDGSILIRTTCKRPPGTGPMNDRDFLRITTGLRQTPKWELAALEILKERKLGVRETYVESFHKTYLITSRFRRTSKSTWTLTDDIGAVVFFTRELPSYYDVSLATEEELHDVERSARASESWQRSFGDVLARINAMKVTTTSLSRGQYLYTITEGSVVNCRICNKMLDEREIIEFKYSFIR